MEEVPSCFICGDVAGMYEPLLALEPGRAHTTSLTREPLLAAGETAVLHYACATAAGLLTDQQPPAV